MTTVADAPASLRSIGQPRGSGMVVLVRAPSSAATVVLEPLPAPTVAVGWSQPALGEAPAISVTVAEAVTAPIVRVPNAVSLYAAALLPGLLMASSSAA